MYVKPCPKCGRMPIITEGLCFKNGTRRRFIHCPNYCSVLKSQPNKERYLKSIGDFSCMFIGDGDDNKIYKMWNENLK